MTTSNLSYKDYSFADHKEVYLKLEETFKAFGAFYYLIGANARDVQMYKAGVKPSRGTADIDFAIMLQDFETYNNIFIKLKETGFEDAHGNLPYRLFYPKTNTVIDLLPYGQIAEKNTIKFTDRDIELSIIGMKEVGQAAEQFQHPEGFTIPVSSAHGIVILKLISWSEKPDRTKDLTDIKSLLDIAWDLYQEELYQTNSPYADLFDESDFDIHIAAARVMGRKIKSILSKNHELKILITKQIERELKTESGPIAQQLASQTKSTTDEIQIIIEAIWKGMNDG